MCCNNDLFIKFKEFIIFKETLNKNQINVVNVSKVTQDTNLNTNLNTNLKSKTIRNTNLKNYIRKNYIRKKSIEREYKNKEYKEYKEYIRHN